MKCNTCRNNITDRKGYEICKCCEFMTQKMYDRYFGDQKIGCPYYMKRQTVEAKGVAV